MSSLHYWDWAVIAVYLAGLLGMSFWLSRGQTGVKDYYLAGNKAGPVSIALSTTATQCSTNSLLGAPAFVAFTGGLLWLQYELAVPLAMAVLLLFIMPVFRGLNLVSVYAYLERRYGLGTRTALSVLFQIVRAFSTGVTVYALALVFQHLLGVSFGLAVLLVGAFAVLYDFLGGIRAVIYSDVLQLAVLFASIVLVIVLVLRAVGGWEQAMQLVSAETLQTLDWKGHGLGDGATYSFWPMLFGGFFLYVSYYGCDQTQIQRELSSKSVHHSRLSLLIGGLVRFPLVLSYCLLGVCMAAYLQFHPEFVENLFRMERIEGEWVEVKDRNLLVPAFALQFFPVGILGLFLAGLLAAAMSSLDSTINSLSALTLHDLVERYRKKPLRPRTAFWAAKGLTLFWGAVCLLFAFVVGGIADTVIEAVNMIGSLVNGPLLAVFVFGLLTRRTNQPGILIGLSLGFALNLALWRWAPSVSWLWWNVIGFVVTGGAGFVASFCFRADPVGESELLATGENPAFREGLGPWAWAAVGLFVYAALLVLLLVFLPGLLA